MQNAPIRLLVAEGLNGESVLAVSGLEPPTSTLRR